MKLSPKLKGKKWVINASPVIALARVGQVELLAHLPQQVIIPQAVAEEISVGPENGPARQALAGDLFKVIETPPPPPEILAWDLGKGETAVLSFALANLDWTAILDDGAARRCARSFSLTITGTLAVVILAKQHGLIKSATQVLWSLQNNGFRLDEAVIRSPLGAGTNGWGKLVKALQRNPLNALSSF